MFLYLEQIIISWAQYIPLEVFSLIAPFIEEAVPPIPSPSISIIIGSISEIKEYTFFAILILILISAFSKTLGAIFVYFVSSKVEDFFSTKIASFLGITKENIEKFGSKIGKGWRDYFVLTALRSIPVVPSVVLSVGGGLLKIPMRIYIVTTFIGSIVRGSIYLYLGYVGMTVFSDFVKKTTNIESVIQIMIACVFVVFIGYLYYRRRKNSLI